MATIRPQKHSMVKEENKRKEEARGNDLTVDPSAPDAILNCVKQRETGVEPMFGLFFHPQSCQFLDSFDSPPKQYLVSESSERFKAG
jgi:hypothetical protein